MEVIQVAECKQYTTESEAHLYWEEYEYLYRHIEDDDIHKFEKKLRNWEPATKTKILNGMFEFKDYDEVNVCQQENEVNGASFQPRRPLTLAAIFHSPKVLESLLSNGVNVYALDWNGGNVLHCMAAYAVLNPTKEPNICSMYNFINASLSREAMRRLLMQDNNQKLRPIEVAAQLGVFALFRSIFETEGVYLTSERQGLYLHKMYDVTEYETVETFNRSSKSPLQFLAYMDYSNLTDPYAEAMFEWEPILRWIESKFAQNKALILLWFSLRFSYAMLFWFVMMGHVETGDESNNNQTQTNQTSSTTSSTSCAVYVSISPLTFYIIAAYVMFISVVVIISDIYEAIWWKMHRSASRLLTHDMNGHKKLIVRTSWYRTTQFMSVCFILASLATLTYVQYVTIVNQLCAIVTSVCLIWSIFYFVQLMPTIGHYIIVIQSMIGDMLNFLLIFWLMFLPFPYSFYMMIESGLNCEETRDFGDFIRILHDTFLITMNIFNLSRYMDRVEVPWLLGTVHVMFVLVIGVMMLNFLIALFSNIVTTISAHAHLVIPIQRLSVIFTLEGRCKNKLKSYYMNQLKSCPCSVFRNGHIYIHTIESIYDVNPNIKTIEIGTEADNSQDSTDVILYPKNSTITPYDNIKELEPYTPVETI